MQSFEGRCLGGPWDGKMLSHWAKAKELFSINASRASQFDEWEPDGPAYKIGEYRLGDFHHWHWVPTETV